MRSRICLKIPSSPELTPNRSASLRTSNLRILSPKVKNKSFQQKNPATQSAYQRITSKSTLQNLSLPFFLRPTPKNKELSTNTNHKTISFQLHTSDCQIDANSISSFKIPFHSVNECFFHISDPKEFIQFIFNNFLSKEQVLLTVGKVELSRRELQSLQANCNLSRNIIGSCLWYINHKNRRLFKSAETNDRVLIINIAFSEHIFSSEEPYLHSRKNPLKYE